MRYRRLDENGDMTFGHQQADMLRDTPATVAQAILTRLKLSAGEWFLNTLDGTPYLESILGANKQESIEPAIRDRILETQGVSDIEDMTLVIDTDSRTVSIAATINTIYGAAALSGAI